MEQGIEGGLTSGIAVLGLLTINDVHRLIPNIPADFNLFGREYGLAIMVLTKLLGLTWVNKRLFTRTRKPNFLQSYAPISTDDSLDSHFDRIVNLAEMLFNLQHVVGYDAVLKRLLSGNLESTFAELETGAILLRCEIAFRFITEVRRKGSDYDIEITLIDSTKVAADTKARLHTSKLSSSAIYSRLNDARDQLPSDRPSILFLRVAPNLLRPEAHTMPPIDDAVRRLFAGTKRIVSVKVHTVITVYDANIIMHKFMIAKEYYNQRCRWPRDDEWNILQTLSTSHKNWVSLRSILGQPESFTPPYI